MVVVGLAESAVGQVLAVRKTPIDHLDAEGARDFSGV